MYVKNNALVHSSEIITHISDSQVLLTPPLSPSPPPFPQSDPTQHVLELKLKALILDTIHNIDITRLLMETGPNLKDHTHWLWQKQLRHYLKDGGCVQYVQCIYIMCNMNYTYVYIMCNIQ